MKPLKPSLGGQLVADLHSTKNHQESSLWQLRGHQESTGEERMRWAVGGSADGCSDVAASTEELEQLAAAWRLPGLRASQAHPMAGTVGATMACTTLHS